MKALLILILISASAFAQKRVDLKPVSVKPPGTAGTAEAELALLRAQLVQLRLESDYGQRVCMQPDLMRARLAAFAAQQQIEAAKRDSK